ncbi:MAG: hypothetical protein ACI9P3_004986 [Bradyrhizobium sp.]|jgi:hypothetical protein
MLVEFHGVVDAALCAAVVRCKPRKSAWLDLAQ